MMDTPLLEVRDLTVRFPTRFGEFTAVDKIDLSVHAGEIHGLVGESGAGKSTIGSAIMGLLQSPGYVAAGSIRLADIDLGTLTQAQYHRLRGDRISMIFQDPQTSLNPLLSIADQLIETIQQHSDASVKQARTRAIALLEETGIQNADARLDDYPHQFSGGMRQRVVIALALCTDPELIIADEPTTALDVAVQKQILGLIRSLAQIRKVGFILITHDIGVIAEITDRVTVLRNGKVMEKGATADVLGNPQVEYTQALMAAVPRLETRLHRFRNIVAEEPEVAGESDWHVEGASAEVASSWLLSATGSGDDSPDGGTHTNGAIDASVLAQPGSVGSSTGHASTPSSVTTTTALPLLEVANLDVTFNSHKSWFSKSTGFKALSDISLKVFPGEVLGVVGESGSGKSTLAKAIVGLVDPSAGTLKYNNQALPAGSQRSRQHSARRQIQMVFQDPYSSLNNRRTVEDIIAEPLRFYGLAKDRAERRKLVASVLELVEMPQRALLKYPHQFSGGQRQRIAVARALVARPQFLICDEPTSALDVSIQAQMLNLLKDLQANFGLTILFISHNLAVVRQMADRVIVLRNGHEIETAESEQFFLAPEAEYSQLLLRETPSLNLLAPPPASPMLHEQGT